MRRVARRLTELKRRWLHDEPPPISPDVIELRATNQQLQQAAKSLRDTQERMNRILDRVEAEEHARS